MVSKKTLKATTALWKSAVEQELIEGLDIETILGAHYAELALRGDVTLNESGSTRVEAAFETLSELVGADDQ